LLFESLRSNGSLQDSPSRPAEPVTCGRPLRLQVTLATLSASFRRTLSNYPWKLILMLIFHVITISASAITFEPRLRSRDGQARSLVQIGIRSCGDFSALSKVWRKTSPSSPKSHFTLHRVPPTTRWFHTGTKLLILLDWGLSSLVNFCLFESHTHRIAYLGCTAICVVEPNDRQLKILRSPKQSYTGCATMVNLQPEDPFLQVQA
jgi:hypothetical protein